MYRLEGQSTLSRPSDDCSADAQQDVTNSAQAKMIQNHSAKRKSPPPIMQRVVAKTDNARTLRTGTPTNNHGTQDSARTRKRARTDHGTDNSSGTEKEQARVLKQRRKRLSFENTLGHVVEWSHEAHESVRNLEQNQKILEKLRDTQEAEVATLKGGFANLLEATFLYNAKLGEDRGRFDDYEEQASKDRIVVKDLAARIQKQEEDTAAQLQRLPTSQEVTNIMAEERKAREEAMKQSAERLGVTITGDMMLTRDRIDKLDKTINAYQEQSNARISGIGEAVDRRTTETTTELSVLQTRISQLASAKDIQEQLILEREAREKAVGELRGMWTVGASTLFDTRIASLESKFEITTIPRALEPLQDAMIALSASSKQNLEEVKVQMAEAQRKSHMNYDRMVKEMHLKVEAAQTASAEEALEQAHIIRALRDDLSIERSKREELEKIVAQADKYRIDDRQQMVHAIEALKDEFVTKLKAMETAHEVALEASTQNLLVELRVTAENADSRAKEVEALRRKVGEIETDSSREDDLIIAGVRENIKTLTERVDNLSNAAVEARTQDTSKSRTCSQSTSKSVDRHSIESYAENSKCAVRDAAQVEPVEDLPTARIDSPHDPVGAAGLYQILQRPNKLKSSAPPESQHQNAHVAIILSHLNHLTSRVDALLECRGIAKLTSIDVDLLKRQQADHVTDCEAKHFDQSEAMKMLIDSMKGQLQKRIDHNFDLQSDLYQSHRRTDSPRVLDIQSPIRAFKGPEDGTSISHVLRSTVTEKRLASLEARVNTLITAKEMYTLKDLPLRLNSWASSLCSDLDKCKKGVAEDMTTLLALINALQAQYEKQRGENENLSAQFKHILGQIPYRSS